MEFRNIADPRAPVHCHFCERELTRRVYLCCESCPGVEICAECFANGSEGGRHRRTHPYRVFSRLDMTLLEGGWPGYDELLLLKALEGVGYGNWEEARGVVGSKTPEQLELHFQLCYEPFLGRQVTLEARRAEIDARRAAGPLQTLLQRKLAALADVAREARARAERAGLGAERGGGGACGEVLGFMPLREEFDVEYDNDFELYLAEMEFGEEDTAEELRTKDTILEIYNKTLAEREKRKRFVIDYELLDLRGQLQREKQLSPLERQIRGTLKPFMRFMARAEHEELVADLICEAELRQSLEVLLASQHAGVQTLEELESCIYSAERGLPCEERLLELSRLHAQPDALNSLEKRGLRKRPALLEVSGRPGGGEADAAFKDANNFIYNQKQLCDRLGISVKEYILVKEYLVRLAFRDGVVSRRAAGEAFRIDTDKFNSIFDFFIKNDIIIEDAS